MLLKFTAQAKILEIRRAAPDLTCQNKCEENDRKHNHNAQVTSASRSSSCLSFFFFPCFCPSSSSLLSLLLLVNSTCPLLSRHRKKTFPSFFVLSFLFLFSSAGLRAHSRPNNLSVSLLLSVTLSHEYPPVDKKKNVHQLSSLSGFLSVQVPTSTAFREEALSQGSMRSPSTLASFSSSSGTFQSSTSLAPVSQQFRVYATSGRPCSAHACTSVAVHLQIHEKLFYVSIYMYIYTVASVQKYL